MYWFLVSISYVLYVNISFRSFVFVIDFENVARFQRNISKICLKWTKWLYLLTFVLAAILWADQWSRVVKAPFTLVS